MSGDWQWYVLSRAKKGGLGQQYRAVYWDGYGLTYEHNYFLRSIGRL